MVTRLLPLGFALLWSGAALAGGQTDAAFWDHVPETAPQCAHYVDKHLDLTRRAEAAFEAGDVAAGNSYGAQRVQNSAAARACLKAAKQDGDGAKGLSRQTATSGIGGLGSSGMIDQTTGCQCGGAGGALDPSAGGGGIGATGCGCRQGGGLGGASWATRLKRALTPHLGGGVAAPGRADGASWTTRLKRSLTPHFGGGVAAPGRAGACGCGGGQLGGLQGFYPSGAAAPADQPAGYVAHASCDSQALRDAGMEVAAPVPGREGKECFWAEGGKSLAAEELRKLQLDAQRTAAQRTQNCRCAAAAIEELNRAATKNAAQSGAGVQKQVEGALGE